MILPNNVHYLLIFLLCFVKGGVIVTGTLVPSTLPTFLLLCGVVQIDYYISRVKPINCYRLFFDDLVILVLLLILIGTYTGA